MNNQKITVLAMSAVLLFSGALFSSAQVVCRDWNVYKSEIFKMAKEQDKFIIMLAGHSGCGHCQTYSDILGFNDNGRIESIEKGKDGPLKYLVDENYITWYSYSPGGGRYEDNVRVYVDEILASKPPFLPLIGIINPDEPEKNFAFTSGESSDFEYPKTIEKMEKFLAIDLLSSSDLEWYKDKDEVFDLAKEQNKYIFKLVGKGTSPNSHAFMKQLNEDLLKQLLEENYILWYSDDFQEINTLSGDEVKPLPYISIIYPEAPDELLEEEWGTQEDKALENMLKSYLVSNETILAENKVSISGNALQISNQTNKEQIYIFTVTGQQVASVPKNDYHVTINTSNFPQGILIIHSSTGWSAKVINQ